MSVSDWILIFVVVFGCYIIRDLWIDFKQEQFIKKLKDNEGKWVDDGKGNRWMITSIDNTPSKKGD